MQGDIENKIYRILNDVELSDEQKIKKILVNKDVYDVYPFSFLNFVNQIKSSDSQSLKSYGEQTLYFLRYYLDINDDDRSELQKICDKNLIIYKTSVNTILTDLNDLIYKALNGIPISSPSYQPDKTFRPINPQPITASSQTYKPLPSKVIGSASYNNSTEVNSELTSYQSKIIIWSDFDPYHKNSSQVSSLSPSTTPPPPPPRISSPPPPPPPPSRPSTPPPPPPPPPRENPDILKFSSKSLLPLPILTGDNGPVGESEITVMSKVVPDKADSQDVYQVSSAIISDQNNQAVLFPLPNRLDSGGNELPQQNIDSPVVFVNQNQGVEANDLAMQDRNAFLQGTFVMPQRLEPEGSSNVSSTMPNEVPVIPFKSNSSESLSDTGSGLSSNPDKEKSAEDESGEKKTRCFGCVFSRVRERITGYISEIKMGGILKFFSASCLGSSKSRVEPGPTPGS